MFSKLGNQIPMLSENRKDPHIIQDVKWRALYENHLKQSLTVLADFVVSHGTVGVRPHLISVITLLEESSVFPRLSELRLQLINLVHPLPLRLGLLYRWEPRMMEIIDSPAFGRVQKSYLLDLAEYYLISGQISRALTTADRVLKDSESTSTEVANAARIQFNAFRTLGQPDKADHIHQECGNKLGLLASQEGLYEDDLPAWLKFQQSELEILREKGKTEEALALANRMITLNEKLKSPHNTLSAELHVHRSTLLWVKARYPESIRDLQFATDLYAREGDLFNSESLKSNLGLVYWTMGELDKAEENLVEAIRFYQRCGADQLTTYDIGNLGLVYLARGDLEKARRQTLEHIRHAEEIGFTTEAFRGHNNLGDILYYFGEYEQAIDEHEEIDKYFSKRGSRESYGLGRVWIACSRASLGEVASAISELQTILEWCSHHESRVLEALTHRALAQWLPLEEREPHLQKSVALAREQGRQLEEAAGLLMLAHVLKVPEQRDETWRSGVRILERIGAISWLKGASIDHPPFIAMFI
jgi:tetratricopeptide (TPR) repeat protein